jgi:pentatricopeptide repeat protein
MFFRSVKNYSQVAKRGLYLRMIGLKEKERRLYEKNLNNFNLSDFERLNIRFLLGEWHFKNKDFRTANGFFDDVFNPENYKSGYIYNKAFNSVIESYIQDNQHQKARELLKEFLKEAK